MRHSCSIRLGVDALRATAGIGVVAKEAARSVVASSHAVWRCCWATDRTVAAVVHVVEQIRLATVAVSDGRVAISSVGAAGQSADLLVAGWLGTSIGLAYKPALPTVHGIVQNVSFAAAVLALAARSRGAIRVPVQAGEAAHPVDAPVVARRMDRITRFASAAMRRVRSYVLLTTVPIISVAVLVPVIADQRAALRRVSVLTQCVGRMWNKRAICINAIAARVHVGQVRLASSLLSHCSLLCS